MKRGEYHSFKCETCKDNPIFRNSTKELIEHLKTVHDVSDLKGTRSLDIHLDEPDYFRSVYSLDIHGIKVGETLRLKRTKEDAAYWK